MRTAVLIAVLALFAGPAFAHTACGKGDFESGLDSSEWSGGHGVVLRNGDPHFRSFTAGLIPGDAGGPLDAASSHQTWVGATELDPVIGRRVAPGGSAHAVRIGNSFCDARADMLAKTFVVGAAETTIRFSYAVVLQDGGHGHAEQSSFWVRVLDASGTPIGGAVRLEGDRDKLVAGDSSLFRKSGTNIFYRDWTRASIDLSGHVGRRVTVQFITEDCTEGGHYAYAYVDDFCDTHCGAALDVELPAGCETGAVRVRYALPVVAGATGSVMLRLDVLHGGEVVPELSKFSELLTSGTEYVFSIEPLIAAFAGGFDLKATGTFYVGEEVCEIRTAGSEPDGIAPGRHNDFSAIVNGGFESGNVGFTSDFTHVSGTVLPGEYAVLTAAEALAVACTWRAVSLACDAEGRFLAVNGDTGEASRRMRKVWSQTVPVIEGADYRFSANFRSLPTCGFDVSPAVEMRFSTSPDASRFVIEAGSCSEPCSGACSDHPCTWQTESRDLHIAPGVTTLTCEIWLDETEAGDGNDLAIDDISLCRVTP